MKKVTQTLSRPPFGLDKILVAVISKIKYILVSIKPQKININIYIYIYIYVIYIYIYNIYMNYYKSLIKKIEIADRNSGHHSLMHKKFKSCLDYPCENCLPIADRLEKTKQK